MRSTSDGPRHPTVLVRLDTIACFTNLHRATMCGWRSSAAWFGSTVIVLWGVPLLTLVCVATRRFSLWLAPLLAAVGVVKDRFWAAEDRNVPPTALPRRSDVALRVGLGLAGGAVVLRALAARLPGMNPPSLWARRLGLWGAHPIRDRFLDVVTSPIHVAPGPLVLWRWMYAAHPGSRMGAAAPSVPLRPRSDSTDCARHVPADAATTPSHCWPARPLRSYNSSRTIRSTFGSTHVGVRRDGTLSAGGDAVACATAAAVDPRHFRRVAIGGGVATFFAVPAVFVTFPIVNLGALSRDPLLDSTSREATARRPLERRSFTTRWSSPLGGCYATDRTPSIRSDYAGGFMPVDSLAAAWNFLVDQGGRLLDDQSARLDRGMELQPGRSVVDTTLHRARVDLAAGSDNETRYFGLVLRRVLRSAALLRVPSGSIRSVIGRPDIFAFPVTICLFAAGVHAATAALPNGADVARCGRCHPSS